MTTTYITMTEDEFDTRYPLIPNHLNPSAGWALGEGSGCLFETYGEELAFVRQQDPRTVWTFVDGDDDDQYIISGYHQVNRIGYLISTVPVPEGIEIEVRMSMESEYGLEPDEAVARLMDPHQHLSAIAREHLNIPTLKSRRSDSLDFSDVSVCAVRNALSATFDAGRRSARSALRAIVRPCFGCHGSEVVRKGAVSHSGDILVLDRLNHGGAKTMGSAIDNEFKEAITEVFVNAQSRSTVVVAFVFAYGWWHIYQQNSEGTPKNWIVTVGHKFRTDDEGREFLLSKGWTKLDS